MKVSYADLAETVALQRMSAQHGYDYKYLVSRNLPMLREGDRYTGTGPWGEEKIVYWLKDAQQTYRNLISAGLINNKTALRDHGIGLLPELIKRHQAGERRHP